MSADGSSGSITFIANRDWTVSWSESWMHVSPAYGKASDGPVTLSVSCDFNTTYNDRMATVTIRAEDLTQSVTIKQLQNLGVIVPTKSYELAANTRSLEVEVQSNIQYVVSISDNWIRQIGTKTLTTDKLSFSVEENDSYDSRSATITVTPQNAMAQEQVISVTQAPRDALIVNDTSFDMPYGGGEIEVKVEANVSYDVTTDVDWIHHIETKVMSSSTVSLIVDENETYSKREGHIEIKQKNGSISYTITVKQDKRIAVATVSLDRAPLTLTVGRTETLTATVAPENASDKSVTWSSSDTSVATVDGNGVITTKKCGTVIITARAGNASASCTVTVAGEMVVQTYSCEVGNVIKMRVVALNQLVPAEGNGVDILKKNWVSTVAVVGESTYDLEPYNGVTSSWKSRYTWTFYFKNSSAQSALNNASSRPVTIVMRDVWENEYAFVFEEDQSSSAKDYSYSSSSPQGPGMVAVDLGLSVKWASCNLGADKPEKYGDYYAWGETEPKQIYGWNTYKWSDTDGKKITKYCASGSESFWGGPGSPDNKMQLDPEDDAAIMKLGGKWRMPTKEEWQELGEKCRREWVEVDRKMGCRVTGPNGNSIFFPTPGFYFYLKLDSESYVEGRQLDAGHIGYYWSSTRDENGVLGAWGATFDDTLGRERGVTVSEYLSIYYDLRCYGYSVRPVTE